MKAEKKNTESQMKWKRTENIAQRYFKAEQKSVKKICQPAVQAYSSYSAPRYTLNGQPVTASLLHPGFLQN